MEELKRQVSKELFDLICEDIQNNPHDWVLSCDGYANCSRMLGIRYSTIGYTSSSATPLPAKLLEEGILTLEDTGYYFSNEQEKKIKEIAKKVEEEKLIEREKDIINKFKSKKRNRRN